MVTRRVTCPQCNGTFCFLDMQNVSVFVDTSVPAKRRRVLEGPIPESLVELAVAEVAQP